MKFNLIPYAVSWGFLALVVLTLIVYRRAVSSREDDSIHLEGSMNVQQTALTHKLASIDRWGKALTIITVFFGIALAVTYFYQIWNTVPSY